LTEFLEPNSSNARVNRAFLGQGGTLIKKMLQQKEREQKAEYWVGEKQTKMGEKKCLFWKVERGGAKTWFVENLEGELKVKKKKN